MFETLAEQEMCVVARLPLITQLARIVYDIESL